MCNVQDENHAKFWVRGPSIMTEISKDCSIAGLPGLSSILGTKQGTDGWYIDPVSQKVGFFFVRAVGDWSLLHGPYEKDDLLVRTSTQSLHLSAMHVCNLRVNPSYIVMTCLLFVLSGLRQGVKACSRSWWRVCRHRECSDFLQRSNTARGDVLK
jgi:hypothetical protein